MRDDADLFAGRGLVRTDDGETYHCELMTPVRRMTYEFEQRLGVLYLPPYCCTDMAGAIALFRRLDPEVQQVQTFAGSERDTVYALVGTALVATEAPDAADAPSSAPNVRPVSIISIMRAVPTRRGMRTEPPPPTKMPRVHSGSA
jgi:hypothetical protein